MTTHYLQQGPVADAKMTICVVTATDMALGNLEGASKTVPAPAGMTWDIISTLDMCRMMMFGGPQERILILSHIPGIGRDKQEGDSLATQWALMETHIKFGTRWELPALARRDTGWLTLTHKDTGERVHLGILAAMSQDKCPLFDLSADAETILTRIQTLGSVLGVPWRMTAGVTACVSFREDRAERGRANVTIDADGNHRGEPHWRWDTAPEGLHGAGFLVWKRELTRAELTGQVVKFDIRAQYLAALANAKLGWGKPNQSAQEFTPGTGRAGFWLIPVPHIPGPMLTHRKTEDGYTWVTTPVMEWLAHWGIHPRVYESWTSSTSSELARPWALKVRNALNVDALEPIAPALKRSYSEMVGMFNAPGGSIYRPDWHATVVDLATMNLRRKINKAKEALGIWPCEIYHDAVSYPVTSPDEWAALTTALGVESSPKIGRFRYVGTTPANQWTSRVRSTHR